MLSHRSHAEQKPAHAHTHSRTSLIIKGGRGKGGAVTMLQQQSKGALKGVCNSRRVGVLGAGDRWLDPIDSVVWSLVGPCSHGFRVHLWNAPKQQSWRERKRERVSEKERESICAEGLCGALIFVSKKFARTFQLLLIILQFYMYLFYFLLSFPFLLNKMKIFFNLCCCF